MEADFNTPLLSGEPEEPGEYQEPYGLMPPTSGFPTYLPDDMLPGRAEVLFGDLEQRVFDKVQSRRGGEAKQRVENGVIGMEAVCQGNILLDVKVWVFREAEAAALHGDKNGRVALPVKMGTHEIDKYYFSVDLDSVFDGPNGKVYDLAKVETTKRNLFQLVVVLGFIDGTCSQEFLSPIFPLRSKPRIKKRKIEGDGDLFPDNSPTGSQDATSVWVSSPDSLSSACSSFHNLKIFEHLEAKRADIGELSYVVMRPATGQADVGYHFKLSDLAACDEYEEGDIVGFFKDEEGQTCIGLLDNTNAKEAFMAGVISRSAHLEAKPVDCDKSDIVCVIGVVKVKCVGSVRAGERLYATVDMKRGGVATPGSGLPASALLGGNNTLLGMSMEEVKAKDPQDVSLVRSFVCIVMGISSKQISMEVEGMYMHFEKEVKVKLLKERKRMRRVLCRAFVALLVFLGLLGFLLFQIFYPGSMLRYWMCKEGSIGGHTAEFKFVPLGDTAQRYHVRGVEFTFDQLKDKASLPFPMNDTASRYFLNLDRCAFGGVRLSSTLSVDERRQVGGPLVFAVNRDCTHTYYFQEKPHEGWKRYRSAWDIKCKPDHVA